MKNSAKILFQGAIIGCLFLFVQIGKADAKTFLLQDNGNYDMEVKIVFDFKSLADQAQAQILLDLWQQGINQIWQKNFCNLNFKADLAVMSPDLSCADYPDYHCIKVVPAKRTSHGNIAEVAMASTASNASGQWTISTTGLEAAHEVGHLLGLKDEYHYLDLGKKDFYNDNLKNIGAQSIMAQTWGKVAALKEHFLKIFNLGNDSSLGYCFDIQTRQPLAVSDFLISAAGEKVYQSSVESDELAGYLLKAESDSHIYLMSNGQLHLSSPTQAQKFFGPDWRKQALEFNDGIFGGFAFGKNI